MPTNIKIMNLALYNASVHLAEASKHLMNVPEFSDQTAVLLLMADRLASIIQPDIQRMTFENMSSVLQEIAAFANKDVSL